MGRTTKADDSRSFQISLGDGGQCALQGSLHPDGIQCPLLSLGTVHSLKSQNPGAIAI